MSSILRGAAALLLLVAVLETFRPGVGGWWLARLATVRQAEAWCRHACSHALAPEGFTRGGFVVEACQGTVASAQRLTTHRVDDRLVWKFWRGTDLVAQCTLRAPDKQGVGWWYAGAELQLVKTCLQRMADSPDPLSVRERGAPYPNLRYVLFVRADGRVVGCLVALWKT